MTGVTDRLNTSFFDVNFMVVRVIILFFISSHSFSSLHSQSTLAAEGSKTFFLKEVVRFLIFKHGHRSPEAAYEVLGC